LSGGAAGKWQSTSRIRDVGQTRELNAKNRNGGAEKKKISRKIQNVFNIVMQWQRK